LAQRVLDATQQGALDLLGATRLLQIG
jgi:hypothetical protein